MNLADLAREGVGDDATAGIWVTDRDGRTTFANGRLATMLGTTVAEIHGRSVYDFLFIDDVPRAIETRENLSAGVIEFRQARFQHRNGSEVWASVVVARLSDRDDDLVGTVSIFSDITAQRKMEDALRRSEELLRLALSISNVTLFSQDRDLTYTWVQNSQLIPAERIVGQQDVDLFGEEPARDLLAFKREVIDSGRGARRRIEVGLPGGPRVFDIALEPLVDDGGRVAGLAGAATNVTAHAQIETALRESEEYLRRHLATQPIAGALIAPRRSAGGRRRRVSDWAERLRDAVEGDGLALHLLPSWNIRRREITRFDALVRLPDDAGEPPPPAVFLHHAERAGLMAKVDRWVVGESIRLMAEDRAAGGEAPFAVNLSADSIADDGLPSWIGDRLAAAGLEPGALALEISEHDVVADLPRVRKLVDALSAVGCLTALDNFGASLGAISAFTEVAFDSIKIDGRLIQGMSARRSDRLVVRSVIDIAQGLGRFSVALEVQDEATLESLLDFGVDRAQGYALGPARPAAEWLAVPRPQQPTPRRPADR